MSALEIEARAFRAGDEELLADGLARAALSAGSSAVPRATEELLWRYGRAPRGARLAFALDERGRALAGVAATRHAALLEGEPVHWLEVGDLFNDFGQGRGLSRAPGLLAAGRAFAEAFGGSAPEQHPVMYGLPDRRAHRLGLAHLEWEVLRSENRLALDLARALPAADASLALEEPARFPAEIERAFRAYARGRAAILVRDAAALDWRYVDRPGPAHARVVARRGGELVGYAVQRDGWLLDWVAEPEDAGLVAALLGWGRERARAQGHARLCAVSPDSAPEWLLFQRLGFRVEGTHEYLCFRSFQRPAIMSWLFQRWSYTRGDTLRS